MKPAPRALLALLCATSMTAAACGPGAVAPDAGAAEAGMDSAADAPADTRPDVPRDVYTGPITARFVLPRGGAHADFSIPWPTDLALDATGHVDFSWIPNRRNTPLVQNYVTLLAGKVDGFSTVAAAYVRFSGPIDQATLPSLTESRTPGSSVQIIDVDPASSERGRRVPLQFHFRAAETAFWPANTLAVAPMWGFPLRPHTRYALVVTDAVHSEGGGPSMRDADLTAVLSPSGGDEHVARARTLYSPAVEEVTRAGVDMAHVISLSVFTTQDPVTEMFRAIEAAGATPAPTLQPDVRRVSVVEQFSTFTGHYGPSPVFQAGPTPYDEMGSGGFVNDAMGRPTPQGMINISFALTVPPGDMPATGWPIVVYAHGTGGDASSFIEDDTAARLAEQGVAVLGFDQIFNGERTHGVAMGGSPEVQFFNFLNPIAGRTNNRQAAIDLAQAARLVRGLVIPATTPVAVAMGMPAMTIGREVRFDPNRVGFMGHSQGSLAGPLWLAAEQGGTIAMLSGAGSSFNLAVTQKREPVDIPATLALILSIPSTSDELGPLHPVLTMLQTAIDCSDPVNYARYLAREPRMGVTPRNVFLTQGFVDSYSPPPTAAALAIAIGLPLINPVLHTVEQYDLSGVPAATLPVMGNATGGMATLGWQQFDAPRGRDGHFVVFSVPEASSRMARFFGTWARSPQHTAGLLP